MDFEQEMACLTSILTTRSGRSHCAAYRKNNPQAKPQRPTVVCLGGSLVSLPKKCLTNQYRQISHRSSSQDWYFLWTSLKRTVPMWSFSVSWASNRPRHYSEMCCKSSFEAVNEKKRRTTITTGTVTRPNLGKCHLSERNLCQGLVLGPAHVPFTGCNMSSACLEEPYYAVIILRYC